jgi:hypothetical protein
MNIWLDDERPMPEGYDIHVKTAEEAIELLKSGKVTSISLDHDLGQDKTGYDVAKWIEEAAYDGRLAPIHLVIHTQNVAGRANIAAALQNANRFWGYNCTK